MAKNKDGFEPGQNVSFEDIMRSRKQQPQSEEKTRKTKSKTNDGEA